MLDLCSVVETLHLRLRLRLPEKLAPTPVTREAGSDSSCSVKTWNLYFLSDIFYLEQLPFFHEINKFI